MAISMNADLVKIDDCIGALQNAYQGAWASTTIYSQYQQVVYDGAIYISLQNSNQNNPPATASLWWEQLYQGVGGGGAVYQVTQFSGSTFDSQLQNCINSFAAPYGGTCDGRNYPGTVVLAGAIAITNPNVHVILPCSTITTAYSVSVGAGTRNVYIEGCSYQGGSTSNGTEGGTVWVYTGNGAAFQVGDPTYAQDTKGFWLNNINLNTAGAGTSAQGIYFYRAQEVRLDNLYINGNQLTGQTGITLDGTGNYAGGTFIDVVIGGFGTGWYLTGHLIGSVIDDYANASTFVKAHVACPTSGGSPVAGTYGINVMGGDGNTWSGGDIEGCATMFHFGANATSNTVNGLRNENSTVQYQADVGSDYNAVFTGGTFFTGQLIDNGSRNSFWDAFHRTVNGMKGDWYASQQDATIINHLRLGIGTGNVRGLQWESQVDSGSGTQYNWLWGLTDGTSGQSNWIYQDLINNAIRILIQQNNTAGSGNTTAVNATGAGNVCFNCSSNSGTGGVAFSSGGTNPTTVATVDSSGDAYFDGTLQAVGEATFQNSVEIKNNANVENDFILWAGSTVAQKESLTYKNYAGTSQWYALNNATNDWSLNSAVGGLDSFKAYQSTNSGDTYINASNSTGAVRVNYESGSGMAFDIYGSGTLYASFTGTTSIKFPGLASASGHGLAQLDNSGYLSNTGSIIVSGTVTGSGTTATHSFTINFTSTPSCIPAPTSNAGTWYISARSVSGFTITYNTSGAQTFNVICYGAGGAW